MTNKEVIKMLTAKAECMRRETSGTDFDCNFRNCYKCDLNYEQGTIGDQIEALSVAISALQAQDVPDTNVGDMVSRQKAIDALCRRCDLVSDDEPCTEKCNDIKILKMLPSAQPEPSIPISWIEKQIDWLKSIDNEFSKITAMNISTLVKKWRKENGKDEQSD